MARNFDNTDETKLCGPRQWRCREILCSSQLFGVCYSLHTSGLVVASGCDEGRTRLLQRISAAESVPTGVPSFVSDEFRGSVVPTVCVHRKIPWQCRSNGSRYGLGKSLGSVVSTVPAGDML